MKKIQLSSKPYCQPNLSNQLKNWCTQRALFYYPCQLSLSLSLSLEIPTFQVCLLVFFFLVCKSVPVFMCYVCAFQMKNKILLLLQTKANPTMIWCVPNTYGGKPRPEKALLVRALGQLVWDVLALLPWSLLAHCFPTPLSWMDCRTGPGRAKFLLLYDILGLAGAVHFFLSWYSGVFWI